MSDEAGMLTLDALSRLVAEERIDTVAVVFPDLFGRLMGKRVDADFFLEQVAESGTHACNYLLTVDMEMAPVTGYAFANWGKGYGDFSLTPDLSALRTADWLNRTAMVVCDLHSDADHKPVLQAPRTILKAQIQTAAEHGYRAMAGSELEHFLFRNTYRQAYDKNYSKRS
jgi:glutamine synthetase